MDTLRRTSVKIPLQHRKTRSVPAQEALPTRPPVESEGSSEPETAEPALLPSSRSFDAVGLPRRLTRLLWGVAGIDLLSGATLLLIEAQKMPCAGRLCEVTTLNGHAQAAGVISLIVAAVLVGIAPFTGG